MTRRMIALASAVFVLAVAGTVGKATAAPQTAAVEGSNPLLHAVSNRCVRLVRQSGQERLVNTCGSCRIVQVKRERSQVTGPPALRSYTVIEGGNVTLPFKGPGRTRLATEQPCASPSQQSVPVEDQIVQDPGSYQCIRPLSVPGQGLVLANICQECRAVIVERSKSGRPLKMEAVTLPGKSMTPLAAKGATGARLIQEGACR